VGEFKKQLDGYDDDMLLDFSSLDYNDLKIRSPSIVIDTKAIGRHLNS